MIDEEMALQGREALMTAIATILEDEHVHAVTPARDAAGAVAQRLRQAGQDIAALAAAAEVLARRAATALD